MARLVNQLLHVLRTYTTRWTFVGAAVLLIVLVGAGLLASARSADSPGGLPSMYRVWMLTGFPAFFATQGIAAQAKRHFAHPRSRLLPGFALPHLLVLFSLALAVGMLLPASAAIAWRLPALGLITYCSTIVVLFMWSSHAQSMGWAAVVVVIWFSPLIPAGQAFWGFVDPASARIYLPLILALDWAAAAGFGWRLAHLTEEMDDYYGQVDISALDTSPRALRWRRNQFRILSGRRQLATQLSDLWHDRLAEARPSPARLGAYGFDSLPITVRSLLIAVMVVVLGWFYLSIGLLDGLGRSGSRGSPSAGWGMVLLLLIGLPAVLVGYLQPLRRWPQFQMELLRPASREDFVKTLFTALLLRAGVMLSVLVVGLAAGFAGPLARELRNLGASPAAQAAWVGMVLVVLVAGLVVCLAVAAWLLAVVRGWIGYLLLTLVVSLFSIPIGLSVEFHQALVGWPGALVVAVQLGLAAWIWRSAYHRWLRLELGAAG